MNLRRAHGQNHRVNYLINDVESYFRQSIYVPYIEHFWMRISKKFEDQTIKCQSLWNFLSKCTETLASSSETNNVLELYQQDVDSKIVAVPEITC